MKTYFTSICLLIAFCSFSQTHFQKGYFIKNNGEKTECLIENNDWKNNPTSFKYKLTENSEIETADISQINEFAIASISKFIKQKVDIDISSNNIGNLSYLKDPDWETRTVFLKVLQEGEASLYFYAAPSLNRYFYNIDGGKIIQLIYKRYNLRNQKIAKNQSYRQQLYNSFLSCPSLKMQDFNSIEYNAVSLSKIIIAYNNCKNSETVSFKQSNKDLKFSLKIKGGINSTTVNKLENAHVSAKNATFGTQLGYRFAIEGEVVLPFNNNKWGLFFELAKVMKTSMESENPSGYVKFTYDYFELPFGVRHYFFLNDESKISIHLGYAWDVASKLDLQYETLEDIYNEAPSGSVFFGAGYHFKKISVEGRMNIKQVFERNTASYSSDYNNLSVTLGYTLF